MQESDENLTEIIDRWSIPLRGLLPNLSIMWPFPPGETSVAKPSNREPSSGETILGGFASRTVTPESDPVLYGRIKRKMAKNPMQIAGGAQFDPTVPAKRYGNYLRQVFKERGIKQDEIARRIGMTPSDIRRIFKNPERSRLATIRKIADAAGVVLNPH